MDKKEYRGLLEQIAIYPLILGGDLNSQIRSLKIYGCKWITVKKDE